MIRERLMAWLRTNGYPLVEWGDNVPLEDLATMIIDAREVTND